MPTTKESIIAQARRNFHLSLCESVLSIADGIATNADASQNSSCFLALEVARSLGAKEKAKPAGQNMGNNFEKVVEAFLKESFTALSEFRPGSWRIFQVGSRNGNEISPDIIIARELVTDDQFNRSTFLVDGDVAKAADLRDGPGKLPLLHASVSTKWTLRSDRAQNARSEALNLIRNRKGRTPHIVLVTGEPTPSRLSSIALGTGDMDCVYHFALYELVAAAQKLNNDEALSMLDILISGKRLKDISDLPLDLAT